MKGKLICIWHLKHEDMKVNLAGRESSLCLKGIGAYDIFCITLLLDKCDKLRDYEDRPPILLYDNNPRFVFFAAGFSFPMSYDLPSLFRYTPNLVKVFFHPALVIN